MEIALIINLIVILIITVFNSIKTIYDFIQMQSLASKKAKAFKFIVRKSDIDATYSDGYITVKSSKIKVLDGSRLDGVGQIKFEGKPIFALWENAEYICFGVDSKGCGVDIQE